MVVSPLQAGWQFVVLHKPCRMEAVVFSVVLPRGVHLLGRRTVTSRIFRDVFATDLSHGLAGTRGLCGIPHTYIHQQRRQHHQ